MAMASRWHRRVFSPGVAKVQMMNLRILGMLAILGTATVASLHAQDKPPSTPAPKKEVPSSSTPTPPSSPAGQDRSQPTDAPKKNEPGLPTPDPAPSKPGAEGVPAKEATLRQLAEQEMLNAVVLTKEGARRFQFTIDPKSPLKDLLPVPPAVRSSAAPMLAKDLTQVPEIQFQMPLDKKLANDEALKQTAHMMAKINHLNDKNPDGFMTALRGERVDLAGLPFAMGDACRTLGDRSKQFAIEVNMVRAAMQPNVNAVTFNFPRADGSIATGIRFAALASQPAPALVPTAQEVGLPVAAPPAPTPPQSPTGPPVGAAAPQPPVGAPAAAPVPPPIALAPDSGVVIERTVVNGTLSVDRTIGPPVSAPVSAEKFWENYKTLCANADKELPKSDRCHQEIVTLARIAALMQVLAPESSDMRLGLVKYLSGISHAQATRALAKMSIFSTEDAVRQSAIDSLKVRRERDYTDVLLGGLRYPWPDVARRSAEAMVKLDRTDLIGQLVDFLDEPDPRAPVAKEVDHKKVFEARELVRVNHHRNCLMCHAPANTGNVAAETLTAAVPTPQAPLPSPSQGYQNSIPDILVRLDVTYLRQDFSMLQAVADANPWPEMQRFDFLVRTRTLTEKEADAYREQLATKEPGVLSPYHRAAVAALRELTGRDAAPTPEAWRQLLKLPAMPTRTAMAR
jgi:hypothetical protein